MGEDLGSARRRQRVDRTRSAVAAMRRDVHGWLSGHRADRHFSRFTHHFHVLGTVLGRMLDALDAGLDAIPAGEASGEVYDRCRGLDRGLTVVWRMFEWYTAKYDQRLDAGTAPLLRAADEVVRSCWSEPFVALGVKPPTGALPYLDPRFDAFATPRASVPVDLRASADLAVAEFVRELPIPTIALPSWAVREAWWLVAVAHESGHHIQKDLASGVEAATADALAEAVTAAGGADVAADWVRWQAEVFADAYSVLMVGEAAATWAVTELAHTAPGPLAAPPQPGERCPPPAVRLALLAHLGRRAGAPPAPPAARAPHVPRAPATGVDRHLAVLPAVADALADLRLGDSTLLRVSGIRPDWFAAGGRVPAWAAALGREPMTISQAARRVRPAARQAVAAGVGAYLAAIAAAATPAAATSPASGTTISGGSPNPLPRLHRRLVDLLAGCGEPGVLAAGPPAAEVDALARRLAERLLRLAAESAESAGPGDPLDGAATAPPGSGHPAGRPAIRTPFVSGSRTG